MLAQTEGALVLDVHVAHVAEVLALLVLAAGAARGAGVAADSVVRGVVAIAYGVAVVSRRLALHLVAVVAAAAVVAVVAAVACAARSSCVLRLWLLLLTFRNRRQRDLR